ncbi:MAG: N-methyl-L-tryptophan oxidase [Planctomycetes bacterium]|nr:N-methyl-L-tryptophan oxidase [Planctomycetota bacterium]
MKTYDTIVIGLGGMGSAVLYHLARRGQRAVGIEQFGIGHDRGSSHGRTRIIRRAYFEHPGYIPLIDTSYRLWAELESDTGRTLMRRTGLLLLGRPDGVVIPGVRQAAAEHQLAIDEVPLSEVRRRFPGLRPTDQMEALYEADAGYLLCDDCVRAHIEQAQAHGATLVTDTPVQRWQADDGGVEVWTEGAHFHAGHLVVCGGAWSAELLSELDLPFVVRRKVVMWFDATGEECTLQAGCPVFCFDTADGFFYGFPRMDDDGVKVAEHTGGELVDRAGQVDRTLHPTDLEPVRRFIEAHLVGVATSPRRHAICMYTMTPDENFIVDRHPQHPRVLIAAGFSGHGFKLAPIIGCTVADLIIDGATTAPIGFLRASREAMTR